MIYIGQERIYAYFYYMFRTQLQKKEQVLEIIKKNIHQKSDLLNSGLCGNIVSDLEKLDLIFKKQVKFVEEDFSNTDERDFSNYFIFDGIGRFSNLDSYCNNDSFNLIRIYDLNDSSSNAYSEILDFLLTIYPEII